jgi:hypothetical protein
VHSTQEIIERLLELIRVLTFPRLACSPVAQFQVRDRIFGAYWRLVRGKSRPWSLLDLAIDFNLLFLLVRLVLAIGGLCGIWLATNAQTRTDRRLFSRSASIERRTRGREHLRSGSRARGKSTTRERGLSSGEPVLQQDP